MMLIVPETEEAIRSTILEFQFPSAPLVTMIGMTAAVATISAATEYEINILPKTRRTGDVREA